MLWLTQIIRKVFLEDWVMKLVALAITLALWLGVTGLSKPTTLRLTGISLDIHYSGNIELISSSTEKINLVVSGDSRKVSTMRAEGLAATIDISEVPPGERVIPLTPETVFVFPLENGVKVEEILPRTLTVRIENIEVKDVPVVVETSGQLPPGYEIYDTIVTPARVRVRGPSSYIRPLESLPTERIDLSGRTVDFSSLQTPFTITNPKSTIVSEVALADVTFKIGEQRIEKLFHVPIGEGSVQHVDVRLFGGRSVLQNLRVSDLQIEIDRGVSGETPRVILPPPLEGKVEIRKVELRN